MLSYLRENTGNWIIKMFLGIIVVVFIFLGVGSIGSKKGNSIATVNSEPVTIKEYQQAYKSIVDQYKAQFGKNLNEETVKALNIKQQALDALINQKIILSEANKLKIFVSEKELQDSIISFKAFQVNGVFDMNQYKNVLKRESLNPEIFEQLQKISLQEEKFKSLLFSAIQVSDIEAKNWYEYLNTKIALNYIWIDPKKYKDIYPNNEQIKQYFSENEDKYKSEPKMKVEYISFQPSDYKDKVTITDAQVQDYYNQHQNEFKIPEMAEASHILIKLDEKASEEAVKEAEKRALNIYDMTKGTSFETLAKKYSEDTSKANGGYLGKFQRQQMVEPFSDQVFSMKAGEISKPIRTMFGWHIIKVISRTNAATLTLSQASEQIRQNLLKRELQGLAYQKAGEAFDAVIDGDDFEQVAKIVGSQIIQTGEFTRSGEGLDMSGNKDFANVAFDLTVDNISDIKQIGDSFYLIKAVKKIEPAAQDLDQVKEKLVGDLKEKLQRAKAKEDAKLYIEKLKDVITLDKLAKVSNAELRNTQLFSRNGAIEDFGQSREFIEAGFSLNDKKPIYPEIIETAQGYYLIGLKEKKIPDENEISENLKNLKNEIFWRKQSQFFQAWLNEIKKHYSIQYDPQFLN